MRFQRSPDVTYDVVDGHAVLIDPGAVQMLTLNPVGTLVWQHLDDDKTCEELTKALLPLLTGVSAEQLELDISSFLRTLADAGLVTTADVGA